MADDDWGQPYKGVLIRSISDTLGRERSEREHALPEFLRHLVEQVLLHQVNQLQPVAQCLVCIQNPLRVHLHRLLLFGHCCREDQPWRAETHSLNETLLPLGDDGQGAVWSYACVVVVDGQGEFVETYSTEARFFTTESDKFFVPGVEDTVDFDVEHFPTELAGVVTPITTIFLPLQSIPRQFLTKAELPSQLPQLLEGSHCYWCGLLHACPELLNSLVTDILPDDELILANFFIGILVVLLGKVDAHTAQQFGREWAYFLVEFSIQGICLREMFLQKGQEVQSLLVAHCDGFRQLALLQQSFSKQWFKQKLAYSLPEYHCRHPFSQLGQLRRGGWGRGFFDLVDLSADMLGLHELVLFGLLLTEQLLADHHIPTQVCNLAGQLQVRLSPSQSPHLVLVEIQVAAFCVGGETDHVHGLLGVEQGWFRELSGAILAFAATEFVNNWQIMREGSFELESSSRARKWQIISKFLCVSHCLLSQSLCCLMPPDDIFTGQLNVGLFLGILLLDVLEAVEEGLLRNGLCLQVQVQSAHFLYFSLLEEVFTQLQHFLDLAICWLGQQSLEVSTTLETTHEGGGLFFWGLLGDILFCLPEDLLHCRCTYLIQIAQAF